MCVCVCVCVCDNVHECVYLSTRECATHIQNIICSTNECTVLYSIHTVLPGLSDTVCSQNTRRITQVAGQVRKICVHRDSQCC